MTERHPLTAQARLAYTMIRVSDLARSLDFYTRVLGMRLVHREDFPAGRFTLAFVGYGDAGAPTIELTHNWGDHAYSHGTGFGHIALAVGDVHAATAAVAERGAEVIRPAGPMQSGSEVIAFIRDPDGYRIELVEGHRR